MDAISNSGIFPPKVQAEQWKESSEEKELTEEKVYVVLGKKEKKSVNVTIFSKEIHNYFSTKYSKEQIEDVSDIFLEK